MEAITPDFSRNFSPPLSPVLQEQVNLWGSGSTHVNQRDALSQNKMWAVHIHVEPLVEDFHLYYLTALQQFQPL